MNQLWRPHGIASPTTGMNIRGMELLYAHFLRKTIIQTIGLGPSQPAEAQTVDGTG